MDKLYKKEDELYEDVDVLKKFGHIDRSDRTFTFLTCRICGGPKLGHKEEERNCKEKEYSEEEKQKIQKEVSNNILFEVRLAELDTRKIARTCVICNKSFENRCKKNNMIKKPTKIPLLTNLPNFVKES
jgi:hypothetical protein